jgi:hypothetical protein
LDVLRSQYFLEVSKICTALSSAQFLFHFRNSYGPAKLIKVENFHPLYAQKSAKNPDMFKGGEKIRKAPAVFVDKFCLLLF